MKELNKYWVVILLIPLLGITQNNKLDGFNNLVNKTWVAEGKWADSSPFKQEVSYVYDLNKAIVIANSNGFTDQKHSESGKRNHGIRRYNTKKDQIEFWEFDVFGGLTKGSVITENKNVWYTYTYGETTITDCWEYINDTTYKFIVGDYKNDTWETIYLQTTFKLKTN